MLSQLIDLKEYFRNPLIDQCSDCQKWFDVDDLVTIDIETFCEDCIPPCDECGQVKETASNYRCDACEIEVAA